jgi:hypothetical protein
LFDLILKRCCNHHVIDIQHNNHHIVAISFYEYAGISAKLLEAEGHQKLANKLMPLARRLLESVESFLQAKKLALR